MKSARGFERVLKHQVKKVHVMSQASSMNFFPLFMACTYTAFDLRWHERMLERGIAPSLGVAGE